MELKLYFCDIGVNLPNYIPYLGGHEDLTNSRSIVKVLWGHLSVSVEARFEGINSICISYILSKIIPSSNGR